MHSLTAQDVQLALAQVGHRLSHRGIAVQLVIAGGVAGLLGGMLRPGRTTGDCDVMLLSDWAAWAEVQAAAEVVAEVMGLPKSWLSRDCAIYAWCLPLGWRDRLERVGTFGTLTVLRISRFDLIAAKLMSCPKRPQDVEDLQDLKPTAAEWDDVQKHLDRLELEDLSGSTFDDQRAILGVLRGNNNHP